jgi:hypothetical protein
MKTVLEILSYFGYHNPVKAYQSMPMDKLIELIRLYYELNK